MWTNPNDTAGGGDNDHNGFVDDLHGWNFVSGTNDVMDDNIWKCCDENGNPILTNAYHGTHVSGIIGAMGNNNRGISGVCWNVKIMAVKTHDAYGSGPDDWIINGIDYATQNGAFLSNNSYGEEDEANPAMQGAISRALQKSKLFIASAGQPPVGGDEGKNNDLYPHYPASYSSDNIIAVLATDANDHKWYSSNYGSQSVDIGAPGVQIYSTKRGDAYQYLTGTSMAAPHVAGVAALALGLCPGVTYSRLKSMILNGANDVPDLDGICTSEGRLNARNVLNALWGAAPPNAPSSLSASPTAWNIILLHWSDNANNEVGFQVQRKDQYQSVFLHDNCADSNGIPTVSFEDTTIDPTKGRTYTYRVRAVNKAGKSSFTNTASATVPNTLPAAPTNLEAPWAIYPYVLLTWWDNANNELHYYLQRRISGGGQWSLIASLLPNRISYEDHNVQMGTTYDYRVRAHNPVGYSSYSNVVTVEVIGR